MEAPRQDEPGRFGPYTVLARLRETAAAAQYLARGADPGELVVVTAARPGLAASPAFRHRFDAEADLAGRLAGGWVDGPLETRTDGADAPWTAAVYVPALTLAEAIEAAGPLPGRAVRILGAGLAETLSRVHATGAVLHGLAPGTVLLAEDGPRLTAFGPLGAAAEASAGPGGRLSVRLGYLTPEQLAGEEAGPASDLFVLGLLLAYAATGTTPLADGPPAEAADRIAQAAPELGGVPDELRDLIARCLAKDPADRPTAGTVAAELALEGAAALAAPGWLPEELAAAVAEQGAEARRLADAAPDPAAPAPDSAPLSDAAPVSAAPPVNLPVPVQNASVENPVSDQYPVSDENPSGARGAHPPKSYGDVWDAVAPAPRPEPEPDIQDAVPPRHEPTPVPAWQQPTVAGGSTVPDASAGIPDTRTTQLGAIGQQGQPAPWPDQSGYGYPQQQPQHPYQHQAPQPVPVPLPPAPLPNVAPPAEPRRSGPSRRGLLFGAAGGVAGLLVGGGTLYALTSGDDDKPGPDPKPAPTSGGPSVAGAAPTPRWVYNHPDSDPLPRTAAVWKDRLLVLTDDSQASAVDLRTGRRVWQNADGAKGQAALAAGDEFCFIATPTEFLWLSAKDGKAAHRVPFSDGFQGVPGMTIRTLVGSEGATIWFTGSHRTTVKAPKPKKGQKPGKDQQVVKSYLFGYDIVQRKELWRAPVPNAVGPIAPVLRLIAIRPDAIVVRQERLTLTPADLKAAKNKGVFRSFDRRTGKAQWSRTFGNVNLGGAAVGDKDGMLYAAEGSGLRAFETPGGKARWTLKATANGSVFGPSLPAGDVLYTTNRNHMVGAVDRRSGKPAWQRSTEAAGTGSAVLSVSSTGDTLLAADTGQVTVFSTADGKRLWKFQDIGDQGPEGETVNAGYQVLAYDKTAIVRRGRTVYAFPVA
ncbi:PQQ-binding-like beta-propeller repeat protein [Streptomyces sp. NPDC097595]|uniref:outer membrane protein assembly factor BamB family protein n=1 Tax=Streptomyces sp. NPDC097595 TaxID=3366090 RepID=UPI003814AC54